MIAEKINSLLSGKGCKAKMIKELGMRPNTVYDFLSGKTTKIGIKNLEIILDYLDVELIQSSDKKK